MFCKNCGKEIDTDSKFCSFCGTELKKIVSDKKKTEEVFKENSLKEDSKSVESPKSSVKHSETQNENKISENLNAVTKKLEKMNSFCIAGIILSILMFFFNPWGFFSYAAFVISLIGYKKTKQNKEKGQKLAFICILIAGLFSLIAIFHLFQYLQVEQNIASETSSIYDFFNSLAE